MVEGGGGIAVTKGLAGMAMAEGANRREAAKEAMETTENNFMTGNRSKNSRKSLISICFT